MLDFMRRRTKPLVRSVLSDEESRALAPGAIILPAIDSLRQLEAANDASATRNQFLYNRLALIYGRQVNLDLTMSAPYRMMDSEPVIWRRGKEGVVPTRKNMMLPRWREIWVTPATAEALIARDG